MKLKLKKFLALVAAIGLGAAPAFAAENPKDEIKSAAEEIDQLLKPVPRTGYVQVAGGKKRGKMFPAPKPEAFYPALAELLQLNQAEVSKALKKTGFQVSDLVFAKMLAAKNEVPFAEVLEERSTDAWLKQLNQNKVPLAEVQTVLENVYVELAFLTLGKRS